MGSEVDASQQMLSLIGFVASVALAFVMGDVLLVGGVRHYLPLVLVANGQGALLHPVTNS